MIIPKYIASLVYGALIEAVASENGARMQAMDNATSNADDMIASLSLKFNRARQASITQELTDYIRCKCHRIIICSLHSSIMIL